MKIGIIGGGISGLTAAKMLQATHEVEVLEREAAIGGIARVRMIDDIPYHTVGGHCFNSKNPEIMDFIFSQVMPASHWNKIQRIAKISFRGHYINYPIEFSVRQIAQFDENLAYRMTKDFFEAKDSPTENLEDWFQQKFGSTLAEEYFIPYNRKIWGREPADMSPAWVEGKLPIPDKKQFFHGLIETQIDSMPHAIFHYPKSNTQNELIDKLGEGLKITSNYEVIKIEKCGSEFIVNGEKKYDLIISTMPLNVLPFVIDQAPESIRQAAKLLKYNKVTNMLWETDEVEATWTYYPEAKFIFHRHIHIGNFMRPQKNYTITETIGERPPEFIEQAGQKIEYLKKPLGYHTSDYAYVVFDNHYSGSVTAIKEYLKTTGIHTLGRFGEWEYYNMDICMEKALELCKVISQ